MLINQITRLPPPRVHTKRIGAKTFRITFAQNAHMPHKEAVHVAFHFLDILGRLSGPPVEKLPAIFHRIIYSRQMKFREKRVQWQTERGAASVCARVPVRIRRVSGITPFAKLTFGLFSHFRKVSIFSNFLCTPRSSFQALEPAISSLQR